jgi:hypothetical protein
MFAVVYWNHGGFQYSNASHKPTALSKANFLCRIFHPKGLKTEKFLCKDVFNYPKVLMRTKKGLGGRPDPISMAKRQAFLFVLCVTYV